MTTIDVARRSDHDFGAVNVAPDGVAEGVSAARAVAAAFAAGGASDGGAAAAAGPNAPLMSDNTRPSRAIRLNEVLFT